jgi:UDP-glucose:glycoprotein glucosyltransferase
VLFSRLNQRILSTDNPQHLDMHTGAAYPDIEDVKVLATLNNEDLTATLLKHIRYFESKNSGEKFMKSRLHFITIKVVTDLNTKRGKKLLTGALEFLKGSSGARLTFIPNTDKPAVSNSKDKQDLNAIVWSILNTYDGKEAADRALRALSGKEEISDNVKGFLKATELHLKMLRVYCQRVLKMKSGETSVIANGRIFGPFDDEEAFTVDDFNLLEKINQQQYINKIKVALKDIKTDDFDLELSSDLMLRLLSLLMPRHSSKNRFNIPSELREDFTVVKLQPKVKDEPSFNIVAVLDPASRGAQKLAPLLILLRQVINCDLKLFLCAVDKHSDMPVKNFYRYVIEPELQFTPEGKLSNGPAAKFIGLPANHLLTQNLAVPENWMADLIQSVYDLDNIRLQDIGGPVHSEYELEYLLLEGHCFDTTTGSPPRGLQFILGTKEQEAVVDTVSCVK